MGRLTQVASNGRSYNACDNCGAIGGVVHYKCTYSVRYHDEPNAYPVCSGVRACKRCRATGVGYAREHAWCKEVAIPMQAKIDEEYKRLAAGEFVVRSAVGDWHESVPSGCVVVYCQNVKGEDLWIQMPKGAYNQGGYASDYIEIRVSPLSLKSKNALAAQS